MSSMTITNTVPPRVVIDQGRGAQGSPGATDYNELENVPETFPPSEHNHDDRYYTEDETDELVQGAIDLIPETNWDSISGKPSTFPPSTHTHDDRYYTEDEIDASLDAVAQEISNEATARANADSAEATARTNAISSEATARSNAISSEASTRSTADTTETNARIAADAVVAENAANLVTAEATARDIAIMAAIAGLINSAPGLMNTLDEISAALGDDPNFAASMTTALNGKQAHNAILDSLAGLASAANKLPYFSGVDTVTMTDFTNFARTLLASATNSDARTALGLGTSATLDVASSGNASAGQVVKGSDGRLSDARTPLAHSHPATGISDSTSVGRALMTAPDVAAGRTALSLGDSAPKNVGTASGTVAAGDDSRITGAVAKSLYDANTLLIATTDDTPIALTVAASRVLGRKASGDISAMTAAELWTILSAGSGHPEVLIVALSDESTAITTGTAKVTMRMPFAMTLTSVRASLTIASSSGIPTVNIKESGVSILSTKLTIDATELTSTTAATPAVISDANLADDAEVTFDIDVAGTGAKGLKVYLIGTRA